MFRYNDRFGTKYIDRFLRGVHVEPCTDYILSFESLGGAVGVWVNHCFAVTVQPASYFDRCNEWTKHAVTFTTTAKLEKQAAFENWGISFFKKINSLYITGLEDTYIDNVRLTRADAPQTNLLVGGDFEAPEQDAVYDNNWRGMFLGESGKAFRITLTEDPLNPRNHCLLLPKLTASPQYPASLTVRTSAFGFYKDITPITIHYRDTLGTPEHLLLFVERGNVQVCDEQSFSVAAGSGLLLPKGTPTHFTMEHGKGTSYYWLYFSGDEIDTLVTEFSQGHVTSFTPKNISFLTAYIDRMLQFPDDNPFYPYAVSGYLQVLLAELSRFTTAAETVNDREMLLERVAERLREQPEITVSNEELANSCGFSVGHFIRLFRQYKGCTPHQYQIQTIMQKAATLLRETTLPVREIAFSLGMDNALYFSNAFRRFYGVAPTEYRKQKREVT